jgi:hypothetical protein
MRCILPAFAVAAAVLLAALAQHAWAQDAVNDSRRSMGNLRPDAYTAGRAIQGSNRVLRRGTPTLVIPRPQPYYGYAYPYYYGYDPYYPPVYGYRPYYRAPYPYYSRGYVYPPLIAVPAETLYGPRAVRRFMGAPW